MQKKKKLNRYTVISVISLIVFFVGWELIVRLGLVDPGKLSAQTSVIELFIEKLSSEYPDGEYLGEPAYCFRRLCHGLYHWYPPWPADGIL